MQERERERERQTDRQTDRQRQRECIVSFSMSGQFLEDRVYLNISSVCYTTTQEPLVPFHDIYQQSGTQVYESLRRRDLRIWLFLQFYTHSHTDTLIMSHLILCKLHTLLTGELLHRQETNCCQPLVEGHKTYIADTSTLVLAILRSCPETLHKVRP